MLHLAAAEPAKTLGRQRAPSIDRYVAGRIRARRIELAGLGGREKWSQSAVAAQIGVTYQQLHKYESGVNRVTAGRLYDLACALGVEVAYFFEGLPGMGESENTSNSAADQLEVRRRKLRDEIVALNENVSRIPDERVRSGLVDIARVLAKVEGDGSVG